MSIENEQIENVNENTNENVSENISENSTENNNENVSEKNNKNVQENKEYSEEELLKQEHVVESVLFMMGDSVELATIALALDCGKKTAIAACERLKQKCIDEHRGIKIIKLDTKYQMVSNDEYFDNLVIVAANPKKPILTDAVIETLAIIAYKQPITKTEIEKIRGVSSEHTVGRLLEYKLIEEAGRLDAPGRPILFKTSEDFLRRFGVESMEDLPTLSAERQAEIENEVKQEIKDSFGDVVLTDENKSENNNDSNESNEANDSNETNVLNELNETNGSNETNEVADVNNSNETNNINDIEESNFPTSNEEPTGTKENPTRVDI